MNTLEQKETTAQIAYYIEQLREVMKLEYGERFSFAVFAQGKLIAAQSKDYGSVKAKEKP